MKFNIDGELVFITGTAGPIKKLEPISSDVSLQHTDPTHSVKLGALFAYIYKRCFVVVVIIFNIVFICFVFYHIIYVV